MLSIRETLAGWQVLRDGCAVDRNGERAFYAAFATEQEARDVLAHLRARGWRVSYFRKARAAGLGAARAWEYATVRDRFENEENENRVRLLTVADDFAQGIDDLCPPAGPGDNVRAVAAQRKEVERMLERDGVSGILAQVVRPGCEDRADASRDDERSPLWETVDSLFGILGDPFDAESGCEYDYATDLRAAALRAIDEREQDARMSMAKRLRDLRRFSRIPNVRVRNGMARVLAKGDA